MDEITRRAFLRLMGGGAAALPMASPLMKAIEGLVPAASSNEAMAQQIMNDLIHARGQDRYPVILDALKQIGYKRDYANRISDYELFDRIRKGLSDAHKTSATSLEEPYLNYGSGELFNEIDLEDYISMDMRVTNPPEEPIAYPGAAKELADFLDLYYVGETREGGPLTDMEAYEELRAEQDIYDAEAGRTSGHLGWEVQDERRNKLWELSKGLFEDLRARDRDLFANHPWHKAFEEAQGERYIDEPSDDVFRDVTPQDAMDLAARAAIDAKEGLFLPGPTQLSKAPKAIKQGKALFDALVKRFRQKPEAPKQLTHQPAQTVDTTIKETKDKVPISLDDEIPF